MPPFIAWIGVLVMAALIGYAIWRTAAFERLGSRLAGDHRHDRLVAERAASPEGISRVAELAATLADDEEVRAIRWTPARSAQGARLALGVCPAAWYLWLPEPEILIRVPDALVDAVDHQLQHDAVVRLACRSRDADACVVATDGRMIEEAADSVALTCSLLDGLLIADPNAGDGVVAEPRQAAVAFGLAS